MNRRHFVKELAALSATHASLSRLWEADWLTVQRARATYGAMIGPNELREDPEMRSLASQVCRSITTPACYWLRVHPEPNRYEFSRMDQAVNFASGSSLRLRAHTLVWHDLLPSWVTQLNAVDLERILETHIRTVVSRYVGRIDQWDVVNEALLPSDGRMNMRRNVFWDRLGPKYVQVAFQAARAADSRALLGYNEFGIEDDSAAAEVKRRAVLNFLKWMRSEGVPIDYLGIQAHLKPQQTFSEEALGKFLRTVHQLGLQVHVTELDVDDSRLPADIGQRDKFVANTYDRFLSIASSQVASITTWGLSDRYTWIATAHPRQDRRASRPLPFDDRMRPKPTWAVLSRYVDAR